MYIERVLNRNYPPSVLLRESYREGKKVRKRTLANLSKLPDEAVENLRVLLKKGTAIENLPDAFKIVRSRPHGHVAAVLGSLKNLGLHNLISGADSRQRRLVLAMIVARILGPSSKSATARGLNEGTYFSSLGEMLGLVGADEDELYSAMDWLLKRQVKIENHLAVKHLTEGTLVLYDVSSTYSEEPTCHLDQFDCNREVKTGKLQFFFGLVCNAQGCPIAVEVFEGNTADQTTLTKQIEKVRSRFMIQRVVWVGDRGIITEARMKQDTDETVQASKSPSTVEQAFHTYKKVDLKVRPIYHHTSERVKAHVFLCMLAYYVEWHMRKALAPLLLDEDDWKNASCKQKSVLMPVERSLKAITKTKKKRTLDDLPLYSFQTLLADLATIVKNRVQSISPEANITFDKITEPTPFQQRALDLLGVRLVCS